MTSQSNAMNRFPQKYVPNLSLPSPSSVSDKLTTQLTSSTTDDNFESSSYDIFYLAHYLNKMFRL